MPSSIPTDEIPESEATGACTVFSIILHSKKKEIYAVVRYYFRRDIHNISSRVSDERNRRIAYFTRSFALSMARSIGCTFSMLYVIFVSRLDFIGRSNGALGR